MFRDASVIDSERTAATVRAAYRQYESAVDSWFDGTPDSIDRRITVCQRLSHICKNATIRLANRPAGMQYIVLANELESDRISLEALRSDILNAGMYREAGPFGPPRVPPQDISPDEAHRTQQTQNYAENTDDGGDVADNPSAGPHGLTADPYGKGQQPNPGQPLREPSAEQLPPERQQYDKNKNDAFSRAREQNPGEGVGDIRQRQPSYKYKPTYSDGSGNSKAPGPINYPDPAQWEDPDQGRLFDYDQKLPGASNVDMQGRMTASRFVELESRSFLADNHCSDLQELVARATIHAELKTSTLSANASHKIVTAFVNRVVELGREAPKRQAHKESATVFDFPDQLFYLQ